MPAIKPSQEKQALIIAAGEINANISRSHLSRQQVMTICGFCQQTYYDRQDSPNNYRLVELQRLARKTNMNPMQAASIVLGRRVTLNEIMNC